MRRGSDIAGDREPLWLVHHHPGRLRVRAARFRDRAEPAGEVCRALRAGGGVRSAAHNARTGSILVEYAPGEADPESLLALAAGTAGLGGVLDSDAMTARRAPPGQWLRSRFEELDGLAREISGGQLDLRDVASAALVATAAWSLLFSSHRRIPRWDNALWWALSVFTRRAASAAPPPGEAPSGAP